MYRELREVTDPGELAARIAEIRRAHGSEAS
jgi:hypothetical protein